MKPQLQLSLRLKHTLPPQKKNQKSLQRVGLTSGQRQGGDKWEINHKKMKCCSANVEKGGLREIPDHDVGGLDLWKHAGTSPAAKKKEKKKRIRDPHQLDGKVQSKRDHRET